MIRCQEKKTQARKQLLQQYINYTTNKLIAEKYIYSIIKQTIRYYNSISTFLLQSACFSSGIDVHITSYFIRLKNCRNLYNSNLLFQDFDPI